MSRDRVIAALGIYTSGGVVAAAGMAALDRSVWHLDYALGGSRAISLPAAGGLGVVVGVTAVLASRAVARRAAWGRALHNELRRGLLGLARGAIAPLALASAVGEELFFRGGVQAALGAWLGPGAGLVLAAALFGLAHAPSNRRLRAWTAMAGVMGLVLGGLYLATGELLAPIAAHAVVNFANLRYLLARDAEEVGSSGGRDSGLAGDRRSARVAARG